jgi:hypothetical protein
VRKDGSIDGNGNTYPWQEHYRDFTTHLEIQPGTYEYQVIGLRDLIMERNITTVEMYGDAFAVNLAVNENARESVKE